MNFFKKAAKPNSGSATPTIFPFLSKRKVFFALIPLPFYVWQLMHWDFFIRVSLSVLPCVFLYTLMVIFEKRFEKKARIDFTFELLLSAVLVILLVLFENFGIWWNLAFLLFWIWIFMMARTGRTGLFYSGFFAVSILFFLLLSFRLVHFQERAVMAAMQIYQRLQIPARIEDLATSRSWQINDGNEEKSYKLSMNQRHFLALQAPDSLYLHDINKVPSSFRFGGSGMLLGIFSAEEGDPVEPPAAVLYLLPAEVQLIDVARSLQQLIGHLQNASQITDIVADEVLLPGFEGFFYQYYDRFYAERMRAGFYIFTLTDQQSPESDIERSGQLMIWIREPVIEGFPHHPDILRLLRTLDFDTGQ